MRALCPSLASPIIICIVWRLLKISRRGVKEEGRERQIERERERDLRVWWKIMAEQQHLYLYTKTTNATATTAEQKGIRQQRADRETRVYGHSQTHPLLLLLRVLLCFFIGKCWNVLLVFFLSFPLFLLRDLILCIATDLFSLGTKVAGI